MVEITNHELQVKYSFRYSVLKRLYELSFFETSQHNYEKKIFRTLQNNSEQMVLF